uniref:HTH_Tnp_Tc3_1 domain-containing protein n=1 Tax=Caenorhabditis japonica TaxID=281687 RepID=A0A8R1ECW4_CAEJA
MGRAGNLMLVEVSKLDVMRMRQMGSSLHEMSRLVKKNKSSIRRYLSDLVNYGYIFGVFCILNRMVITVFRIFFGYA